MGCGFEPKKYSKACLAQLSLGIESTTDATRRFFEENYLSLGLSSDFVEFFFDIKNFDSKWFKYGNFCQRYYGMTPEKARRFDIVQNIFSQSL